MSASFDMVGLGAVMVLGYGPPSFLSSTSVQIPLGEHIPSNYVPIFSKWVHLYLAKNVLLIWMKKIAHLDQKSLFCINTRRVQNQRGKRNVTSLQCSLLTAEF